jgi:hypothetical protein
MDYSTFCRNWLETWTGNRPEALRAFYTDDAFYRDPAKPGGIRGAELLPHFTKLLALNPDWKWEAVEILETRQGFCLKWKATIPVKGQTITETGLDIVELKDGLISRNEVFFDRVNWMRALA